MRLSLEATIKPMTTLAQVSQLFSNLSEQIKQKHPILQGWNIKLNTRLKSCMGRALRGTDGTKIVELSTKLICLNLRTPNFLDKIKETIIHEWSHALDWELHQGWGHGPTWRKCMMSFGLHPERCYDGSLWLRHPNNVQYAIRNSTTGRIWGYLTKYPTQEVLTRAHHWHMIQLMRPVHEDLELIHLDSNTSRPI